ncbi:MAG TPA: protein kinase [Terriglobales bacterium]|nr:protein kinase [Terriglobales bacterium]
MTEQTGRRIGDYEILGVLGAGGMGQVFKVRNVISDRIEAMKVLLPDLAGRQDLANRFLREIKVLAALNHPNIASLRTALTLDNQLVMVMEYVEGVTLAARLEQGPIPVLEALNYIDQVLNALSYAHKQNVIHRDIKPGNMMLMPEGVVKLMDFGIARSASDHSLTTTGMTLGSLHYMSPEQVRGAAIDARSDLYSVGISLYELVTGQPPFRADSDYSLMAAQLQQQPKPPIELCPSIPADLNEIILTALEKDPANRFQTADAFRRAVNNVASALSKVATGVATTAPLSPVATELFQGTLPSADNAATASVGPTAATQPAEAIAASSQIQQVPLSAVAPRSTHRGLYMSMGALIVVAVLALAGLYVPRRSSTRAQELGNAQPQPSASPQLDQSQSTQSSPSQPAPMSGNQVQTAEPAGSTNTSISPAAPLTSTAASADGGKHSGISNAGAIQSLATSSPTTARTQAKRPEVASSVPSDQAPSGANNPAPALGGQSDNSGEISASANAPGTVQQPSANEAQLQELEQEMDQLSSRASSVNDSLDTLRRQQSAQGYGLRGDISSAQQMMKTYMAKAQTALQNQDAKSAKKYLDLAQPQIEALEKFLGH